MMTRKGTLLVSALLALCGLLVIAGCSGSGDGSSGSTISNKGHVTFTLEWPGGRTQLSNLVKSVRLEISSETALLKSRICERPVNGGTLPVMFDNLPAGPLSYTAMAYSANGASGILLGMAQATISILANRNITIPLSVEVSNLVETVSITVPVARVQIGRSLTLTAVAKNAGGTVILADLQWSSDRMSVATVNSVGMVTGVGSGNAQITVRDALSGKSATVTVTVLPNDASVEVVITPRDPSIEVNETVRLTAVTTDSHGVTISDDFLWNSSDTRIATVDSNGRVAGVARGVATITATDTLYDISQSVVVTVTETPLPQTDGKIVFQSDRTGTQQIYRVNADGSGLTRLTNSVGPNENPVFNRDGTQIVYTSGVEGSRSIYLMHADGSNAQAIPTDGGDVSDPSFSPNGQQIAYSSNLGGNWKIYIYDTYSGVSTQITSGAGGDYHPSFSPDGSQITFASDRGGNSDIYIMGVDGGNVRQLTTDASWDGMPLFNPQGTKIAFATNRANGVAYQTYLMNLNGSSQTRVLNVSHCSRTPTVSPDGTQVAYAANPNNQFDIYISKLDGSGFTLLAGGTSREMHPSWAP